MTLERRAAGGLRAAGRRLEGTIPYNVAAAMGGFEEVLGPLALRPEPDVLALYGHGINDLLGRTAAGTLALENRADGLGFSIELPPTRLGDDVKALVERGDLRGASFGFVAVREAWSPDGRRRTVAEARLYEVSVVPVPTYDTALALRARAAGTAPRLSLALRRLELERLCSPGS